MMDALLGELRLDSRVAPGRVPEREELPAIHGQAQGAIPRTRVQRAPEPCFAVGRHLEHAGLDVFRRVGRDINPALLHGDAERGMVELGVLLDGIVGGVVRSDRRSTGCGPAFSGWFLPSISWA